MGKLNAENSQILLGPKGLDLLDDVKNLRGIKISSLLINTLMLEEYQRITVNSSTYQSRQTHQDNIANQGV